MLGIKHTNLSLQRGKHQAFALFIHNAPDCDGSQVVFPCQFSCVTPVEFVHDFLVSYQAIKADPEEFAVLQKLGFQVG